MQLSDGSEVTRCERTTKDAKPGAYAALLALSACTAFGSSEVTPEGTGTAKAWSYSASMMERFSPTEDWIHFCSCH